MASLQMSRLCRLVVLSNTGNSFKCNTITLVNRNIYTTTAKPRSALRMGLVGVGLGAVIGTGYSGYSYYSENVSRRHMVNEQTVAPMLKKLPDYKSTRQIIMPHDKSDLKLVLFQYQTCPFCCKVRAFLDYYGFSYDVVEVDAVLRQSIRWSDYKKVPILVAKGDDGYYQLNDSTMIISALASYTADNTQLISELVNFYPNVSFMDDAGKKNKEIMNKYFLMYQGKQNNRKPEEIINERKWRTWADDNLVHMLSPNVYRTYDEALETFNWFADTGEWRKHFPGWEVTLMIQVGALAMYLLSKRLKTKHNLKENVRESLYDSCDTWVNAMNKSGTPFMGGKSPDLSDLAVYGILNSFEGCGAFKDVLDNTNIGPWYSNMKHSVKNHLGSKNLNDKNANYQL